MSRIHLTRLASLAVVVIAVAACGSSSPSATASLAAPSASAGPGAASTAPAASAGSSSEPMATADPNATPLPSFTRVADLEATLPKTVSGAALHIQSLTGTDVLATGRPADVAALQALLTATGAQPADYAFAYAITPQNSVVGVFRVKGADATKVRDSLIEQGKAATGGLNTVDSGTVGGKKVTIFHVNQNGADWGTYYWPKGDLLYYVQTVDPKAAEAFLSAL